MLSYRATLDVPVATARTVSRWIATHRKTHDVRPWQRAATSWVQAVMLLRWLIQAADVTAVARDAGVSPATGYRYLHEALDVVSSKAPDLPDVLRTLKDEGEPFVCLDGTVILTDRVAERDPDTGYHLWYSGKHKAFGGNVQVVTDHTGYPIWTSPVEPGSVHDITAAREHALPALYPAAADGMPSLADRGYLGAGIGIKVPVKASKPDTGARSYNQVQAYLRAPADRANALLKGFKALKRVTLDPSTITNITATALVILNLNNSLP
ncbi:transposase family protein [Actinomyces procaprae]|uniref:transposase family protein n=1 Tax=Actinomyces procaprae TaxID=2560010 RepID=UPI00109DF6C5|nr:transposase family protein [Actinomyces procaprae]